MGDRNQKGGAPGSPSQTNLQESEARPVGYHNPPEATRFKPGQSGNRRGRPRGAKNHKTIVTKVAMETHTVTEKGKRRRRTNLELVLIALRNLAIEGNVSAFRAYQAYLAKFGPQRGIVRGMLLVPPELTEEEIRAEAEKLNEEGRAHDLAEAMKASRRSTGQSPEIGGPGQSARAGRAPS